jgi:hypothetical protein
MNKKQIFILVSLFFLLASSLAWSTNSNVGTTGFTFLKIGIGARPSALGGAYVAIADDESALSFNPAGIMQTHGRNSSLSYNNFITDIQSGFLAYIHPFKENLKLAACLNYLNYGTFEKTNDQGEKLGTFGASDFALNLSVAQRVKPQILIGVTGKIIYESIEQYSSLALALDFGSMYLFKDGRTRLGASLLNLGTAIEGFVDSRKESLPSALKLGFSHYLRGLPLTIGIDLTKPFDNDIFFNFGGEIKVAQPLVLRTGWSSFGKNFKTDSSKDQYAGLAFGFGINWQKYKLDYAFTSYADLGGVHQVTISGGF